MTKLMLAGVAALALSTGGALAATAPVQHAEQTQRYDYLAQQQSSAPGYSMQSNEAEGVPVISGPGRQKTHPWECWPNCP